MNGIPPSEPAPAETAETPDPVLRTADPEIPVRQPRPPMGARRGQPADEPGHQAAPAVPVHLPDSPPSQVGGPAARTRRRRDYPDVGSRRRAVRPAAPAGPRVQRGAPFFCRVEGVETVSWLPERFAGQREAPARRLRFIRALKGNRWSTRGAMAASRRLKDGYV